VVAPHVEGANPGQALSAESTWVVNHMQLREKPDG
jgi:hypothetical protein